MSYLVCPHCHKIIYKKHKYFHSICKRCKKQFKWKNNYSQKRKFCSSYCYNKWLYKKNCRICGKRRTQSFYALCDTHWKALNSLKAFLKNKGIKYVAKKITKELIITYGLFLDIKRKMKGDIK